MSIEQNEQNAPLSRDMPEEPAGSTGAAAAVPGADPAPDPAWSRRTFLKAAALGTAVAGSLLLDRDRMGRLGLGGTAALANDLSTFPCTANDIDVSTGSVINEPCSCTAGGTFEAVVQFEVTNKNNASRYCITLHLNNGTDVVLYDKNGNSVISGFTTQTMYGTFLKFPCNSGGTKICFGDANGVGRGKCDPGQCSTISFNTSANADCPNDKPPGGQCRHIQVCVEGFGASLSCASGCGGTPSTGPSYCSVECGKSLYLLATASGASQGATAGSYTFTLTGPGGYTATKSGSSPQCFEVTAPQTGTYTLTVTDNKGCTRTATTSVTVQSIKASLSLASTLACDNGVLTFKASATGCDGTPTYEWTNATPDATDKSKAYVKPSLNNDGGLNTVCRNVTVKVTCGSCTDTATMHVTQCVTSTVASGACPP
jgi:hypothetical protein